MSNRKLSEIVAPFHPCEEASIWLSSYTENESQRAWDECPRGDWMLWWLGTLSGKPESPTRKKVAFTACQCARLALPYSTSPTDLACIETTEAWTRGEVNIEKVNKKRRDAYVAAATTTTTAAAYAAASATIAASCSAVYVGVYAAAAATHAVCAGIYAATAVAYAYAAATDAAQKQAQQQTADIVRSFHPNPPSLKELA